MIFVKYLVDHLLLLTCHPPLTKAIRVPETIANKCVCEPHAKKDALEAV